MTALVELVPISDVGVALLRPAARRAGVLLGEDRAAGGHGHDVHVRPIEPLRHLPDALPVQARRRGAGSRKPVKHHVVEELVTREYVLGMAIAIGPRPELLHDPRAEARR